MLNIIFKLSRDDMLPRSTGSIFLATRDVGNVLSEFVRLLYSEGAIQQNQASYYFQNERFRGTYSNVLAVEKYSSSHLNGPAIDHLTATLYHQKGQTKHRDPCYPI